LENVHPLDNLLGFRYRRDEAIAPAGDSLYKAGLFGVVIQDEANFADGAVDAVIGIEKYAFAPNPFDNLLAGDEFTGLFQ
jgi:hypothetical protein